MWASVILCVAMVGALGLPLPLHVLFELRAFTRQYEHWHTY